jgi:hypothetical protein
LPAVAVTLVGVTWGRAASVAAGPPGRVEAKLRFLAGGPEELTIDAAGNIYSADCLDAFAFRVSVKGAMTIVAGNGAQGFSGDGGSALKAKFACPSGVALDANGNLT